MKRILILTLALAFSLSAFTQPQILGKGGSVVSVDSISKYMTAISDSLKNAFAKKSDTGAVTALVTTLGNRIKADSANLIATNAALSGYATTSSLTSGLAGKQPAGTYLVPSDTADKWLKATTVIPVITSAVPFTQTATKTVSATITETSLIGAGVGSMVIPANVPAGRQYRLSLRGVYSTPAISVATILVKITVGGVTMASANISGLTVSASNYDFEGSTTFTIRTAGASGSIMTTGNIIYSAGANVAYPHIALNNGLTAPTMDFTTSKTIDCTVTYSLAVGGNSISSLTASLEQLN